MADTLPVASQLREAPRRGWHPGPFTEPQAAELLGVAARTLRRWRKAGAVGHFLTPGGRVLYAAADLERLTVSMRVEPMLGPNAGQT